MVPKDTHLTGSNHTLLSLQPTIGYYLDYEHTVYFTFVLLSIVVEGTVIAFETCSFIMWILTREYEGLLLLLCVRERKKGSRRKGEEDNEEGGGGRQEEGVWVMWSSEDNFW